VKISPFLQRRRKKHSKSFAEKRTDDEQRHHHPNDHDEDFLFHIPGLFYPRSILDDEKGEEEERDVEEDGSESIVLVAFVVLVVSVPNKPFKESGGEVYIHRFLVLDNLHRDNNCA
jgi:hypothetical protein